MQDWTTYGAGQTSQGASSKFLESHFSNARKADNARRKKLEEDAEKKRKDLYKSFKTNNTSSYLEDGTLQVGDSMFTDNEDGTFTASDGGNIDVQTMQEVIKQQAAQMEEQAKIDEENRFKVSDVPKALWEGATAAYKRTGEGIGEIIGEATGANQEIRDNHTKMQEDNIEMVKLAGSKMKDESLSQEERDRWNKLFKQYASDDSAFEEAREYNEQQLDKVDPVKNAAAMAELGLDVVTMGTAGLAIKGGKASLKTGQLATKANKAANLERAGNLSKLHKETKLDKALKTGLAPEGLKQGAAVGAGLGATYGALGTLEEHGADATVGDYAVNMGIGVAAGGVLGGTVGGLVGRKGRKAAKLEKEANEAAEAANQKHVEELKTKVEDDYLSTQKMKNSKLARETTEKYGEEFSKDFNKSVEGERLKMLEDTNPRPDDAPTTLPDGSIMLPDGAKYNKQANLRLKEIDAQLDKFSRGESKLDGSSAKSLADERQKIVDDINSAYDTKINDGSDVSTANSKLKDIADGVVPDTARTLPKLVKSIDELEGLKGVNDDILANAAEIRQDRIALEGALDPLMTESKFSKLADEMDAEYTKQMERIDIMPPMRRERELAKLEEVYAENLMKMEDDLALHAPQVEEFTRMKNYLDEAESLTLDMVNNDIKQNPGKIFLVDDARLNGAVDEAIAQKAVAEVTENANNLDKPIIGAVENGMRPSKSTNPRVEKAIDDTKIADSNTTSTGVSWVDNALTAPRKVLAKFGEAGQRISDHLSVAADSIGIADHQVAVRIRDWNKAAGGKNGMENIAKALDGDAEAYSGLTDVQKKVHAQIKDMFKAYADRLDLPEDARIKDYLPHIMNNKPAKQLDEAMAQIRSGRDLDGNPLTPEKLKELQKEVKGIDYQTLDMIRRNSQFKVKNGFLERRTGAEDYSFDLADIISTYTHAAHRTEFMKPALEAVKPLSQQLDIDQNKYLARVIQNLDAMPEDAMGDMLDAALASLKLPDGAYSRGSAMARKMVYDAMLGANPGSAVRNLSQGSNTYAKLGEKYTAHGYKMAAAAFRRSNGLFAEAERNGVITNKFSDYLGNSKYGEVKEGFDRGLWYMFSTVEETNRTAAYFGAKQRSLDRFMEAGTKRAAKDGKKFNVDVYNPSEDVAKALGGDLKPGSLSEADRVVYDAHKAAERAGRDMSRTTQFEFGAMDVPIGQSSTTIKNLIQFQSYNLSQARFLAGMLGGEADSLFVQKSVAASKYQIKLPKGINGKEYVMQPEAFLQITRYLGAQTLFISTIGSVMGMSYNEMIPFLDNAQTAIEEEDILAGIPRSPLTQLLIGDGRNKDGWINTGLTVLNGEGDAGKSVVNSLINTATTLVPVGTQGKKTIEGLISTSSGTSTTASGNIGFMQDQDMASRVQAGVFGRYSTGAGKDWIRGGFQSYNEKQSEKINAQETMEDKRRYAEAYDIGKGKSEAREEAKKIFEGGDVDRSFRKAQEYNAEIDKKIAEYRKNHPGALPNEVVKALNDAKINFAKDRKRWSEDD